MPRPSLAEIKAFCAVAHHRSYRRAAEELGVTPSTLSHTINALEQRLGLRLLHRTTRSVATTEAGETLRLRMDPILADFDAAIDAAICFRDSAAGSVRISAAAAAIRPLLDKVITNLLDTHPDLSIEFAAEGRLVDIVEEGFDAGIRFGDAVPQDMIGITIGAKSRFVAVASPGYLAIRGAPRMPDDLAAHRCIRMRLKSGRLLLWKFEKAGVERRIDPRKGVTLDDVTLQVEAAAKGLGIAYVWEPAARPLLDRGDLQIVLDEWSAPAAPLLLYYPANRRVPPALGAFAEALRSTSI